MQATSEVSLPTLARRAMNGEPAALDELLRELQPLVVRTARLIVGSGSWAAEDAAQEAMLDIARGVDDLREPQAVRAWALRIATTRALKVARRERLLSLRRAPVVDQSLAAEASGGRGEAIHDAFARLPPRLRATAVLRLYVGLSEAETAEVLDSSLGTVKSNLHDARKQLTRAIAERGLAPTTVSAKQGDTR
jgi:RNA polymerase sigma factor (sigma-70 family)